MHLLLGSLNALFDEFSESALSNESCATTIGLYLEEPQNLTAEEDGLEIYLDWETPPSAIGVGDPCTTDYGEAGFLDCNGFCFAEAYLIWIGDGYCDGTGMDWGINFSCLTWDCDGCDCVGTGQNSDECVEECGGEENSNPPNPNTTEKEIAEVILDILQLCSILQRFL